MSVLLLLFLLVVTAVYLLLTSPSEGRRCRETRRASPMAPPRSFLWSRRIVLTLLTGFVAGPGLRDGLQLAEAARRTCRATFRWLPSRLTIRPYIDIW